MLTINSVVYLFLEKLLTILLNCSLIRTWTKHCLMFVKQLQSTWTWIRRSVPRQSRLWLHTWWEQMESLTIRRGRRLSSVVWWDDLEKTWATTSGLSSKINWAKSSRLLCIRAVSHLDWYITSQRCLPTTWSMTSRWCWPGTETAYWSISCVTRWRGSISSVRWSHLDSCPPCSLSSFRQQQHVWLSMCTWERTWPTSGCWVWRLHKTKVSHSSDTHAHTWPQTLVSDLTTTQRSVTLQTHTHTWPQTLVSDLTTTQRSVTLQTHTHTWPQTLVSDLTTTQRSVGLWIWYNSLIFPSSSFFVFTCCQMIDLVAWCQY